MKKQSKKKKGFTLIELIAVIAILAILGAVIVPNIISYMDKSKRTNVISSCKVIVNAVEAYNADAAAPIPDTDTITQASDKITAATGVAPWKAVSAPMVVGATIAQVRAAATVTDTNSKTAIPITNGLWAPATPAPATP